MRAVDILKLLVTSFLRSDVFRVDSASDICPHRREGQNNIMYFFYLLSFQREKDSW